ncbi:kelch repeat-containing protein, partial [Kitasatospora sp. NPDC093558]|uniref:kelch repeat-containing protein n=1 Tax=Kitasatospora sp. NPDC093558 TaxID=3155201 RepID=UPI003429F576
SGHTATLLSDGRVLAVGGQNTTGVLTSAEVYDPATGAWSATGDTVNPREEHTATLLSDGRVLAAGGDPADSTAELYDPATGTWSSTGSLTAPHKQHTATLLPSGKVLIAGGETSPSAHPGITALAELYDPATGSWTATGSMTTARLFFPATLLPDGTVLVSGGEDSGSNILASAEVYDPATGSWTATGSMNTARDNHTMTLLLSGKALVAGGQTGAGDTSSSELYPAGPTVTTTLTTAPNPSLFGQPTTLTDTVCPSAATTTPTGTITFADGTTILGTVTLAPGGADHCAQAHLTYTDLLPGAHTLTARYSGDATYPAPSTPESTVQTVDCPAPSPARCPASSLTARAPASWVPPSTAASTPPRAAPCSSPTPRSRATSGPPTAP